MDEEKFVTRVAERIETKLEETFKRHIGVLMEQTHKEIGIIAEQHGSIVAKLEEHDKKFEIIGDKIDNLSDRMDRVDKKLDTTIKQNDQRFKRIEEKVGN